jgi:hypothetical protein
LPDAFKTSRANERLQRVWRTERRTYRPLVESPSSSLSQSRQCPLGLIS